MSDRLIDKGGNDGSDAFQQTENGRFLHEPSIQGTTNPLTNQPTKPTTLSICGTYGDESERMETSVPVYP